MIDKLVIWLMMIMQMRKVFFLKFALGGSPASGGRSNEYRHAEISSGAHRSQAASRHKSRSGLKRKD